MHLYLSSSSPLNAAFATEDGRAIYKVRSPFKLIGSTATISRLVPNLASSKNSARQDYVNVASIEFRSIRSSTIRVGGEKFKTKHYFRKDGWGSYGRHRVFTGPDGREYKWLLRSSTSELITNDGSKTLIARFHQKHFSLFRKTRPAFLEITRAGGHMVDAIVYTFVYIEKVRRDKEKATENAGGG